LCGGTVSALLALHASARAADDPAREEARKLAYAGVASYQASDYQAASDKLERAFAMLPAPSVGLYSARALVKLGKWTRAAARYRQISQLVITAGERNVQEAARKSAATDLVALMPRIPGLHIQLSGASPEQVQVLVDGTTLTASELGSEILLDPGTHQLQGRRGAQVVEATVELRESAHESTVLSFPAPIQPAPQPPPQPPPQPSRATPVAEQAPPPTSTLRTTGWISLAAGGGALALSGVGVLIALAEKPGDCTDNVCAGSVSSYNTWRTVSTVGFYTGVALSAVGVTLLLTAPKSQANAQSLSLTFQAKGASLNGAF
jgi:hypothetical protein